MIQEMLKEQGSQDIELKHVESMKEAEEHLEAFSVHILLLDLGLPDAQGLEAVRRARVAAPGVPLVVLSGLDDESIAVQALHEGAQNISSRAKSNRASLCGLCTMPLNARP